MVKRAFTVSSVNRRVRDPYVLFQGKSRGVRGALRQFIWRSRLLDYMLQLNSVNPQGFSEQKLVLRTPSVIGSPFFFKYLLQFTQSKNG